LLAHTRAANFLERPPVAAHDPDQGATQAPGPGVAAAQTTGGANGASEDEALTFLAPPTRPDSLGRLGHYEVLQVLGRGGFGIVFQAFDEMLQRVVALKVMSPQLAATSPARKRFLREARSSAQVRHENVVQVHEVAEQPLPYLVMEFIPGETLQQKLDRVGPLDVPEVLRIGRQIAEGLAAAHATDLIHRDVKPGNVLLEGGHQKVKITDFGLARAADDASLSQSGNIAGTPMYMAPEQAEGQTLDQRADLFSLGSVLYQMVTGRPPFRANTTVAVLKRVAADKPRAIREIIPETPQWLCDVIAKLHAKDPADRYQSAREVADVLADCEAQLKANAKLKDDSRIPRGQPQPSGRRKARGDAGTGAAGARARQNITAVRLELLAAAAVVLLAVIALGVTEFAGVTHLFRNRDATPNPPGVAPGPIPKGIPPQKDEPSNKHEPPKEETDLAWGQRIRALPAPRQVEEVRKELIRRNPGFDGKMMETKIEGGVVTGLHIVTDKVTAIAPIRVFDALRVLDCSGTWTPGKSHGNGLLADLSPLKGMNLAGLTHLDLGNTKVTDAEMVYFKDCKDLRYLRLNHTKVTDQGLAHFKDCKNLTELHLTGTQVGDMGMIHFQDCKALTRLFLGGTKVGDTGLACFKGMPLTMLWISNTGITDLTPLQGMPLEQIRLTPKNITRGLDILRDMKSLKTIGILWTQAWPAAEFWERYGKGEFK
jgi:eukaryotic-like serine/threonine-protein kinase